MKFEISKTAKLPTSYGTFNITAFREFTKNIDQRDCELEHLVIASEVLPQKPIVRLHSECLTGDVLHSLKCDCGDELTMALKIVAEQGGMVLYLRQEGRGIGLYNKINAYALQDQGKDTIEANEALGYPKDARDYAIVGEMLKHFGIQDMFLLTNNPKKLDLLSQYAKVERMPIIAPTNCYNQDYLKVKKEKMGHLL